MSRSQMFLRMVGRALSVRSGKLLFALAALTVGATLVSTFVSLYLEIPRKITSEFRSLGPNLVVVPRNEEPSLPATLEERIAAEEPQAARLPWLYAVGKVAGEDVVLGGTDFAAIALAHPSWQGLPSDASPRDALLAGEKAAAHFGWKAGDAVTISYGEQQLTLPLAGILSSGGSEDSQLFLPLEQLQRLTGQRGRLSVIELAVPGSAEQITGAWERLAAALGDAEVRPLRPVLESQARVVMKVRGLMLGLAAIVLVLIALSVLATVSGLILDRQKDIGIMKALGGSDRAVSSFFLAEMACVALCASGIGYVAGLGLADWAAQRIFGSAAEGAAVGLRADVLLAVIATTLLVALAGAALPTRRIRALDPAMILRGE